MKHDFKKQFGQNFLRDINAVLEFVNSSGVNGTDNILEIGPGDGAVTEFLIQQAKTVTSIEIDSALTFTLESAFGSNDNFKLINADILKFNEEQFEHRENYKVIGSLPYNISKKIISKFLTSNSPPQSMTVIIQKEVAEDYSAEAPKSAFIANFASLYSDVKYLFPIPAHAFEPKPAVDGAVIQFTNIKPKHAEPLKLKKLIKIGYSSPRKKLSSNLGNVGYNKAVIEDWLKAQGLTESARAGELTLQNWIELYDEEAKTKTLDSPRNG
ncbi:MAG: 16S rRNA (adenine(1518)-N(6)/adenine(1519)-N(6))-dimethyltransferase RsmA [Candidatus Dojkabacteria bacterium]